MREFISNCLNLGLGESIVKQISPLVKLVGDRQEDSVNLMLNLYSPDGDLKDVLMHYRSENYTEDEITQRVTCIMSSLYEMVLNNAYSNYQFEWCKERGFEVTEVLVAFQRGEEYQGQMFVCMDEFEDCEFQEEDIIKNLLSEDLFTVYTFLMNEDEVDG